MANNLHNYFTIFIFSYSGGGARLNPLILQSANVPIFPILDDRQDNEECMI